ncbi:LOW QUALITY PROTEIN: Selenocysteine insertion sequence-binding protein 2, partial [Galemys pyrenaicus]
MIWVQCDMHIPDSAFFWNHQCLRRNSRLKPAVYTECLSSAFDPMIIASPIVTKLLNRKPGYQCMCSFPWDSKALFKKKMSDEQKFDSKKANGTISSDIKSDKGPHLMPTLAESSLESKGYRNQEKLKNVDLPPVPSVNLPGWIFLNCKVQGTVRDRRIKNNPNGDIYTLSLSRFQFYQRKGVGAEIQKLVEVGPLDNTCNSKTHNGRVRDYCSQMLSI